MEHSTITKAEIEKLAALARLSVTAEEVVHLQKEMEEILGYVKHIQEVSQPDTHSFRASPAKNVWREDIPKERDAADTELLLTAAPRREGNYIKVKKVL